MLSKDHTRAEQDEKILRELLKPNFLRPGSGAEDRAGKDWIVHIGNVVKTVDVKNSFSPNQKWWANPTIPELWLERWSVMPSSTCRNGKVGWTLDPTKQTDFILFKTCMEDDEPRAIIMDFTLLRLAFQKNVDVWYARWPRKVRTQHTKARGTMPEWHSQMIYVPLDVLRTAVQDISELEIIRPPEQIVPPPPTPVASEIGRDLFAQMRASLI